LYKEFFSLFDRDILDVFTTNYDRIVEKICNLLSKNLSDGFGVDYRQRTWYWNPSLLGVEQHSHEKGRLERSNYPIPAIWLYKLHGSLNWRRTTDGNIEQFPIEERIRAGGEDSYAENLLIYPGGKSAPISEPFKTLHDCFRDRMDVADLCVVVGFSFRDSYLNEIFREFLKREPTTLISISPNASSNLEANLLKGPIKSLKEKGKIVSIDKPFAMETVHELKKYT
jgi:hypothetical protein